MPTPQNHCSCGASKKVTAEWCRSCWAAVVKKAARPSPQCACGARIRNRAQCCRACWLQAENTRSVQKTSCICGSTKLAKSACCRKCWLQAEALSWQQQIERSCSRCCRHLPVDSFIREANRLGSWCRDCRRDYSRTQASFVIKLRCKLRKHGITLDDYMTLWNLQGGRCAACCDRIEFRSKDAHLDHCHNTGQVRGLLCRSCNQTAGFAKDSPDRLRRLADYLEGRRAK